MNRSELEMARIITAQLTKFWTPYVDAAHEMLTIWGLRSSGGSLKSPYKTSTGQAGGGDRDFAILVYVEGTEIGAYSEVGYFRWAKEALRWIYVEGRPSHQFPITGPGETLHSALLRRRWGLGLGLPRSAVAWAIAEQFTLMLAHRLLTEPFIWEPRPEIAEELDANQIADSLNSPGPVSLRDRYR